MQQLREVMSRDVKLVTPDTTIREAAQQMRDGDFGMLPVAENDRMIGAVSRCGSAVRNLATVTVGAKPAGAGAVEAQARR